MVAYALLREIIKLRKATELSTIQEVSGWLEDGLQGKQSLNIKRPLEVVFIVVAVAAEFFFFFFTFALIVDRSCNVFHAQSSMYLHNYLFTPFSGAVNTYLLKRDLRNIPINNFLFSVPLPPLKGHAYISLSCPIRAIFFVSTKLPYQTVLLYLFLGSLSRSPLCDSF